MASTIRNNLIVNKEDDYGGEYKTHCLEIYKLYVEKADAISARRQSANSFFLTINTALIGVAGYILASGGVINLALSIAGIVLCYFWYRLMLSYKQLNSGKFKVIHEIEKELPLSPYDAEWIAIGQGKDSKLYKPFTDVEINVPFIFMALHFFVFLKVASPYLADIFVLVSEL